SCMSGCAFPLSPCAYCPLIEAFPKRKRRPLGGHSNNTFPIVSRSIRCPRQQLLVVPTKNPIRVVAIGVSRNALPGATSSASLRSNKPDLALQLAVQLASQRNDEVAAI